ncbi:uncharacterized protein LOC128740090 [Sabethes cyaneus]|uniref:uncharacterized protein LOC128740090 n=1 Tax=Sabethes cyaneus TaxID=53552 RepID=UPI00237DCFDC|nr:uncharacterized protein LOC128740090 [Sabethes cyaneus]
MVAPSTSSTVAHHNANASPLSDIKLPRMNMPVFSGNYLDWQSFYDLFESLFHQNPTLTNSQKLYFLKTNLADEAASLISHLKIEDANYQLALEKLKSSLRSLHDVSDEVIRALKAMDREDRDTWLLFILSEKVDPDTKQLWCQKIAEMEESNITLQCFLKFIESRSFALQAAQPAKPKSLQPLTNQPQFRSATSFVATNLLLCNLCNRHNHHIYHCGRFIHMNYENRLAHK